jgi:hypothetical protein
MCVKARTLYPTANSSDVHFAHILKIHTFGEKGYLPLQLGIFDCRRPWDIQVIVHISCQVIRKLTKGQRFLDLSIIVG